MFGLGKKSDHYMNPWTIRYFSVRYQKWITVPVGYFTDGATGGFDVCPYSWIIHDWLCGNWSGKGPKPEGGKFDDGYPCTNWQASTIHSDLLKECSAVTKLGKGKVVLYAMSVWRWPITWLFGGEKLKQW